MSCEKKMNNAGMHHFIPRSSMFAQIKLSSELEMQCDLKFKTFDPSKINKPSKPDCIIESLTKSK